MIVYGVDFDYANKKRFVTTLDPLDHMSGEVESRIQEFDCTPYKKADRWSAPAIRWYDDDGRKLDKYKDPDISYIFPGSFILAPRAAQLLRPAVGDVAELLPMPFQGETWYFMNVFNQIDAVDKAKSRYKIYQSGKVSPVDKSFSPSTRFRMPSCLPSRSPAPSFTTPNTTPTITPTPSKTSSSATNCSAS